ncbi:MAG: Endonuclease/exonuclease/phosphatase [Akkermansiaceae bacterium]|nr:Endonuclease/exonuclease/phosphatase [Akkermansiaceae bacterium]
MFASTRCLLLASLGLISTAGAVNLGTFNLRYDNPEDVAKGNGWSRRAPMIAAMIRFHQFDIVGTQEGLQNQVTDLTALMPEYSTTGCGRDDGKEAGEHVEIFYRKSKFKLLDEGHFWLSETPDQPGSRGWDAKFPRICAWGKFEDLTTHQTLFFFSTHFDHKGVEARKQAAALIVHKIEEIAGEHAAVLTGDFNVDQTSDSYKVLHGSDGLLRDAYELAPLKLAPDGTTNSFDAATRTSSRIDLVFVTKQFNVSRYGVLTDTFRTSPADGPDEHTASPEFPAQVKMEHVEARTPSDHFPVLIEATY